MSQPESRRPGWKSTGVAGNGKTCVPRGATEDKSCLRDGTNYKPNLPTEFEDVVARDDGLRDRIPIVSVAGQLNNRQRQVRDT